MTRQQHVRGKFHVSQVDRHVINDSGNAFRSLCILITVDHLETVAYCQSTEIHNKDVL